VPNEQVVELERRRVFVRQYKRPRREETGCRRSNQGHLKHEKVAQLRQSRHL